MQFNTSIKNDVCDGDLRTQESNKMFQYLTNNVNYTNANGCFYSTGFMNGTSINGIPRDLVDTSSNLRIQKESNPRCPQYKLDPNNIKLQPINNCPSTVTNFLNPAFTRDISSELKTCLQDQVNRIESAPELIRGTTAPPSFYPIIGKNTRNLVIDEYDKLRKQ